MTIEELGNTLNEMYHSKYNGKVANIHLFGIKYGEIIIKNNFSKKEIIKLSGLKTSYSVELNKGVNLSTLVKVK